MDQNALGQSDAGFHKVWYLKKEVRDQVNFSNVDKHQSFLQVDTIAFDGCRYACPKYPKYQVCNILEVSQERDEEWIWFFALR